MSLSAEQLDNWFTYHPPTNDTGPQYQAITEKQKECTELLLKPLLTHDKVNAKLREFADLIDGRAPDSADKTAAIRCVRIARNAINEAIVNARSAEHPPDQCLWTCDVASVVVPCRIAVEDLMKARWQANSAIACGGK